MNITNNPNSVRGILCHIECCVIIHNFLIEEKEAVVDGWIEELDDDGNNVANMIGKYDFPIPGGAVVPNDKRRRRVMEHFFDSGLINEI